MTLRDDRRDWGTEAESGASSTSRRGAASPGAPLAGEARLSSAGACVVVALRGFSPITSSPRAGSASSSRGSCFALPMRRATGRCSGSRGPRSSDEASSLATRRALGALGESSSSSRIPAAWWGGSRAAAWGRVASRTTAVDDGRPSERSERPSEEEGSRRRSSERSSSVPNEAKVSASARATSAASLSARAASTLNFASDATTSANCAPSMRPAASSAFALATTTSSSAAAIECHWP
mmetsp:Transcript_24512/g.97248  ORF Transcript_24512/g.97248 Transcript_24512/m.97248 type:complete len:238 (-) Transcript_24512:25-738(-)